MTGRVFDFVLRVPYQRLSRFASNPAARSEMIVTQAKIASAVTIPIPPLFGILDRDDGQESDGDEHKGAESPKQQIAHL